MVSGGPVMLIGLWLRFTMAGLAAFCRSSIALASPVNEWRTLAMSVPLLSLDACRIALSALRRAVFLPLRQSFNVKPPTNYRAASTAIVIAVIAGVIIYV